MERNNPGCWSQKKIYEELRRIETEQKEKNNYLEEQISRLDFKLDKLLDSVEATQKMLLNSICDRYEDGVAIQSDNHKRLVEKVQNVEELIKEFSCESSVHLDENYNQLQDLMKIIIANDLLKPLGVELEEHI